MPNEYDAASAKPRRRDSPPDTFLPVPAPANVGPEPLPAWPTMIDDTIGSIGSTHGVSESSKPAMKNAPTIGQNEPPRRTASIPLGSAVDGDALELVATAAPPSADPGGSTRAVPAPPKPVRPMAAALCIGG